MSRQEQEIEEDFKEYLPCVSTLLKNSFIATGREKKSKPKRTIERKIASLIFLESHDGGRNIIC